MARREKRLTMRSPRSVAKGRLILAYGILLWEALWPEIGWAFGLLIGFLIFASFDVLPALSGSIHLALLLGWGGCGAAVIFVLGRRLRLPDHAAVLRRLESDSGLLHRPLHVLSDPIASMAADPVTAAFWAAHRRRMADIARQIGWARPRSMLLDTDPYGVRAILVLLLVIGTVFAGGDFASRIARAVAPNLTASSALATGYDLWLTPPDYTGLAPLYLGPDATATSANALAVPVGSTILAQVHGGGDTPVLTLGNDTKPFGSSGRGDYSITDKLADAQHLAISQSSHTLVDRRIEPVPDQPPAASWTGEAKFSAKGAIRLSYSAKDDYGVTALTFRVARADGQEAPLDIKLSIPSRAKQIKSTAYEDLTDSLWAGLPVDVTVIAQDAIGQTGTSEKLRLTLPERVFTNPVAKMIIAQRKLLLANPENAAPVSDSLTAIAEHPDSFLSDPTVFLALRSATIRLVLDRNGDAVPTTAQLLWDTALRVEDGQAPEAQKALREAQQALRDALDRNAPNAEVDALSRALQQAIDRYLSAMAQSYQKNGGTPSSQQGTGKSVSADDIQKMLDQAREMAKTGSRDAAKEALARLQDLLESLKMSGGQGQGKGQGNDAARQALQSLQNLSHQQQQILDKSYQSARKGDAAGNGGDAANLAKAQEALRRQLNELGQQGAAGQASQALDRAEKSMRSATDSLRQGEPTEALGSQGDALHQMQQAMRQIAEQMREQSGEGAQPGQSDPLGRTGGTGLDNGEVKIPTATDMQRSREILDELRKRASERTRPQDERDYIDRLLERF